MPLRVPSKMRLTKFEPMKPAPPVTNNFIYEPQILFANLTSTLKIWT